MNENKAIIDLLAEGLVKQDKLTEKVDLLASAMMDFKKIVASQGRSMEIIASMMQENPGRYQRYQLLVKQRRGL